jgi:hypothetical protein
MPATPGHYARDTESFFFIKEEATYNTTLAFVGTDAVPLHSLTLEHDRPKGRTPERVGSSSPHLRVRTGPQGGKWTAVSFVRLASAGVAPRMEALMKATFGAAGAVVGATSVTWSISGAAAVPSLQLAKRVGSAVYDIGNGGWVEQLKVELPQNELAKLTWTGGFSKYSRVFGAEVAAGGAALGAADVPYKLTHLYNLQVGGRVAFGALTNSGAGYLITAVDQSVNPPEITVSPVLEDAVAEHDEILPWTPTQDTSWGTLLENVESGVALAGGSEIGFRDATVTFNTGYYARQEASSYRPSGILRGDRSVELDLNLVFVDKDNGLYINRALADEQLSVALRLGDTAGLRFRVSIPNLDCDYTPLELNEDGTVASAKLKGVGLQSAAEFDELSIVTN